MMNHPPLFFLQQQEALEESPLSLMFEDLVCRGSTSPRDYRQTP